MHRRRCKVLTTPSGRQARHGRNTCICSRFCGNSAHCNGGAASEEARGRGCSRGLWIAIHKHTCRATWRHGDMARAGRHGRPRASLDQPRPRRNKRTQTLCRHRRSPVDSANRRHQLRAGSCHDLTADAPGWTRDDRRRALMTINSTRACLVGIPRSQGGAGRGSRQEVRVEQVRMVAGLPVQRGTLCSAVGRRVVRG